MQCSMLETFPLGSLRMQMAREMACICPYGWSFQWHCMVNLLVAGSPCCRQVAFLQVAHRG